MPEDKLPLLNKTLAEKNWHFLPPELGGGIQAYIEGFHYIHCLVSVVYFQIIPSSMAGGEQSRD